MRETICVVCGAVFVGKRAPAVDPLSRVPASDRKWLANEARRRGVTPRTIFTEMKNAYIAARAVQRVQERVKDSA